MLRILQAHPEVAAAAAALVLQPQSALEKVRGYLNASGFTLAAEDMVEEDGKFYPMFLVRPGREAPFSEVEQYYGRQLLARRHPVLQRFLARQAQQNRRIRAGLSKNFSARATQRKTELAAEWQRIQAAKAWGQNGF